MLDIIEDEIWHLLKGQGSKISNDICDYTLEQQNEEIGKFKSD